MDVETKKYQKCLYEIFKRTDVIRTFVGKGKTTGYLTTDVELICLQFRKIIELIALGSLVANKEIYSKERERFKEDWNARLIFQDLERMNSKFYPAPVKPTEKINEITKRKYLHFGPVTTGYMTMKDALKIYERCGGVLHADNPYKGDKNIKEIKNMFPTWATRLVNLLNHHTIILNNGQMLFGQMKGKDGLPFVMLYGQVTGDEEIKLKEEMGV